MASSHPATSANVVFGVSLVMSFALDLANCMTRPPPPCMLFIRKMNSRTSRMIGPNVKRMFVKTLFLGTSTSNVLIFLSATAPSACSTRRAPWVPSHLARTFLPSFSVARISWSPSTNVTSLILAFSR